MTDKTDFLVNFNYRPSGLLQSEGFTPTEQLNPTFWDTTSAQLGHSYDSQFEAFMEDLQFNTKGFAKPFSYYFGLAGNDASAFATGAIDYEEYQAQENQRDNPPVPFDPEFNPFDKQLIAGYEEHAMYFADSKNLEHFEFKKRVLDENIARREIIRLSGFWQNLGAAFFDPINFIALPFGGPTVGIGRSMVRVGAGTGLIVGAQEMTRYPFDPLATPGEVAMSTGTAVVFGGLLGGLIGIPLTARARATRVTADDFTRNVQKQNEDIDIATHSVKETQIRGTGNSQSRGAGNKDAFIEDVLVPYNRDQIDDVITESNAITSGIQSRVTILKGKGKDPDYYIKQLAYNSGDTVADYRIRIEKELDDLRQRRLQNNQVQKSKIFKDSKKLAEGKIKQFKVGTEIYDTKKINALADRDQLINNKRAYEKQIPILRKEAIKLNEEMKEMMPKVEPIKAKIETQGSLNTKTQKFEKFGTKLDEEFNPSNQIHQDQLKKYMQKTQVGSEYVSKLEHFQSINSRLKQLNERELDNKIAITGRRKAIDKLNEGFNFAKNIYINSPLFKWVHNPIKDLLMDKTATAISKYHVLKLGFDSGLNLELVKRGKKFGNSILQRKAQHMVKLYDFTIDMRSFYLQSVGMSPLRAGDSLFAMEQVEWQKLYLKPRNLMGGGKQKSEQEFFHDVTVRYIRGEDGDSDLETAAINYMRKVFKKEKIEKEAVGLLGGGNFDRGKVARLKMDIEASQKARDKNLAKIADMEKTIKDGFFIKNNERIKLGSQGEAKLRYHIARNKEWDANYVKSISNKTDKLNEILKKLDDIAEARKSGKEYFDEDFFPRNFNVPMIRANMEEFEELLTSELMKSTYRVLDDGSRKSGTLSRADANKLAQDTIRKILGESEDIVEDIFVGTGVSKHLRSRVLDIPNSKLIKFIHTDPFAVYKKYVQQTSGMVEFKREYGIFKTIDDIQDDIFEEAFRKGLSIEDAERHFMQVRYMYDRVVTNRLHDNPYSWDRRLVGMSRTLAQLSYLGSVVFSTMAEPSVIMMNHGVGKTLSAMFEAFFNPKVRASIKETAKAGEAIDLTLGTSHQRFVNEMSFNAMSDSFWDKAKNGFYIMNGLSVVTTALKRLDGIVRIDHYINTALKISNPEKYGKASKFEVEYLLRYNIGKKEAAKIEGLVDNGTIQKSKDDKSGLWLANTEKWTDIELRDEFRSSVASGVLNTILMGTPADKPKLVDGIVFIRTSTMNKAGLGGLIKESKDYPGYVKFDVPVLGMPFQFFSYSFAAVNKVTASLTQGALKSRVMAPLIGVGLAYFSLSLRKPDYVWDKMSMQDRMLQSFEYSGVAALYMDLFYEALHTTLALRGENITGGFISPKYKDTAHESLVGIMGAGPSHTFDIGQAINEMLRGDLGKGASDLMKISPFLSLPYFKNSVKDLGAAIDERLD